MTTKQSIESMISDFKENKHEKQQACDCMISIRVPPCVKEKYNAVQEETDRALSKLLSQVVVKTINEVKS